MRQYRLLKITTEWNHETEQKQELKTSGLNPHFSNRQNLGETTIYIHKDCEKQVPQSLDPMKQRKQSHKRPADFISLSFGRQDLLC